jgi:hypothetical protein
VDFKQTIACLKLLPLTQVLQSSLPHPSPVCLYAASLSLIIDEMLSGLHLANVVIQTGLHFYVHKNHQPPLSIEKGGKMVEDSKQINRIVLFGAAFRNSLLWVQICRAMSEFFHIRNY